MPGEVAPPQQYDAILVVGFGGPEGPDDVIPFLENVLRGRNVPRERMAEVAEHYYHFGGKSPINDQNRALISALRDLLHREGPRLPVYWGNRNWMPYLADALREMRDDGIQRALGFFTSAYSSYSGCRQYRENIAAAQKEVGAGAPEVHKLRAFYNHPGFIDPFCDSIGRELQAFPHSQRVPIAFTAHSIPIAMAESSEYVSQLEDACSIVANTLAHDKWKLVYQSRSGPPTQPWLGPDILDHMRSLHAAGESELLVAPIGFISDHLEVLYDLDTEAAQVASALGMTMRRAATVGTDPRFIAMIRDLILERLEPGHVRVALGAKGPSHDVCAVDCCPGMRR